MSCPRKQCDECKLEYYVLTSPNMDQLCAVCANHLYGYPLPSVADARPPSVADARPPRKSDNA